MPGPLLLPGDLAPGDARALAVDWTALRCERIGDVDHPWFSRAYDRLWREFGDRNEMEARDVVARRLAHRDPTLRYELLVVRAGDDLVAVRDHTAIATPSGAVVVHLSHVIVEPGHRGGGLAGWLRAFPLQTARTVADAAGLAAPRITLAGEMDPPDPGTPMTLTRLRSYARAGFLLVDPAVVRYAQPDFRPPDVLDATGVQPVPLVLIVRRVGDEASPTITGAAVREIVAALYTIYAINIRPAHMAPLWARLPELPPPDATIALVPPHV